MFFFVCQQITVWYLITSRVNLSLLGEGSNPPPPRSPDVGLRERCVGVTVAEGYHLDPRTKNPEEFQNLTLQSPFYNQVSVDEAPF